MVVTLARNLRNNGTKSEDNLWKVLKGKYRGRYDFHRQKPLTFFIADFYCPKLLLTIEIDGYTHDFEENIQRDFDKECTLHRFGINTLRLPDDAVHQNLSACLAIIDLYIEGFETQDLTQFLPENWNKHILSKAIDQAKWNTPLNPLSKGEFLLKN